MSKSRGAEPGKPITSLILPGPVMPGEDPAAFTALLESLIAEYQPATEGQHITVHEAARAVWELTRANREFDKSQQKLYGDQPNMREWTAAQQAEFDRMLRYRTRAERSYARRWQAVEFLRKLHLQAEQRAFWESLQQEHLALAKQRLQLATERAKAAEAKTAAKEKEKEKPAERFDRLPQIIPLYQIVEVCLREGNMLLNIHPSPEDMYRRSEMVHPGAKVLRCFEFPNGVPAEYEWVNEPDMRHKGIVWEQCFESIAEWRAHADREAKGRPFPTKNKQNVTRPAPPSEPRPSGSGNVCPQAASSEIYSFGITIAPSELI
jgi:hypothetical protein